MTLSELASAALPSILVPFPYAIDDHQTANARYFAQADAALLMPQSELTPQRLAKELKALIQDRDCLSAMAQKAHGLAKLDAARRVAEICLSEAGA
jgi:UDP-N-acetylglucosamine--N-acetylmuramyl-(pentapeptide) pyrophosphoryl-undecaprenol N-acetylglucosamine transferase